MGWLPHVPEMIAKINMMAYKKWLDDGMWKWRAKNWHGALENFGGFALDPKNVKKVYEAP